VAWRLAALRLIHWETLQIDPVSNGGNDQNHSQTTTCMALDTTVVHLPAARSPINHAPDCCRQSRITPAYCDTTGELAGSPLSFILQRLLRRLIAASVCFLFEIIGLTWEAGSEANR
jgi:hypothetical protein